MQLVVIVEGGDQFHSLEVPYDSDLIMVIQLIQSETGIPVDKLQVEFENSIIFSPTFKPPAQMSSLLHFGITDGSALLVKPVAPSSSSHSNSSTTNPTNIPSGNTGMRFINSIYEIPLDSRPEELLTFCEVNPKLLDQFRSNDPDLAVSLDSKDVTKVRSLLMKRSMERHKEKYTEEMELKALEADPMNPELQKKIEERIRLKNIQENMNAALENLPESFGRVTMLYVNLEIEGFAVKAFVDSGAQSTIMSVQCAERCNITRLIDTRFAGEARGVGTAKIIGRVHIAQMRFGNSVFPVSITVLEKNDVDFLFGLDTLRRYRCVIDLGRNVLRIDGSNGPEEIEFLSESELPSNAKQHDPNEQKP